MDEDIIALFIVSTVVLQKLLEIYPSCEGFFVFRILWPKQKSQLVRGKDVFPCIFLDYDDHCSIVVVSVAQCTLAVHELVEVVTSPLLFYVYDAIHLEDRGKEFKNVHRASSEVLTGKEVEKGHRHIFVITPLEVVHAVQACTAESFDLQENVCSLSHVAAYLFRFTNKYAKMGNVTLKY